jgi:nucleoid-associated protein YgaU
LLLALGAAGVTLAVVLGIVGLPAVNACSADPRGVVSCLRDMAERKFDLPGRNPGQVAETAPADVAAPPPPAVVGAGTKPAAASAQSPDTDNVASADPPAEVAAVPVPTVEPVAPAETSQPSLPAAAPSPSDAAPPELPPAPPVTREAAAPPPSRVDELETARPGDVAQTWSAAPQPQGDAAWAAEPPAGAEMSADEPLRPAGYDETPAVAAEVPLKPAAPEPFSAPEQEAPLVAADPGASPATVPSSAPLVLANAEPATAQPPAPTIAAPVVLAPTIDAIELDGARSFVSGSGPAGALMRLYADGQLIGESPVEEGRWLVETSNLLDSPRRELRAEAIEPDTGKLLGVADITVEIEPPDGGVPPDERQEQTPDLGSGVPSTPPTDPLATSPAPRFTPPPSVADPTDTAAVAANERPAAPAPVLEQAEPTIVDEPTLVDEPEAPAPDPIAEPEIAAIASEPLPPLARVLPQGESASVEILAPSTLQPTTLPPAEEDAEGTSTVTLPAPAAPALIAAFEIAAPTASVAPGQPVTILRLLPFGDPDEGRYNVGKAIIRRGDTLWSIARRYYGHGIHYRTIFHANRELIRRPSRIFPGQIFDLPLVTDD